MFVHLVQKRRFAGEGSTEPVEQMTSDDIPALRMLLASET